MPNEIHFIIPEPPAYLSLYRNVIGGIVEPIRNYLPDSTVSADSVPGAINVHFFNEPSYRTDKISGCEGVHVFMSHGMGDKQWRDGPQVDYFNFICVSGPRWTEKLTGQGIPAQRILETGFPKLDPLFQGSISKRSHDKKVILYAPTHTASAPCTSYPDFLTYLNQFPSCWTLLCCAHPYNRPENRPVLQELADADAVISDGSSVIYEAMSLGLPVLFPDWLVREAILKEWPHSFTAEIYREQIGYHAETIDQLIQQTSAALEQAPSERERAFIDGIFPPELRGKSGETTAKALRKLAE